MLKRLLDSDSVAVVIREVLIPVAGRDTPVMPPTFAAQKSDEPSDYCITATDTGNVCDMDTPGSQANRIEPLFMTPPYRDLIPHLAVKMPDGRLINICEMGHRMGDALLRCTDQYGKVVEPAFTAIRDRMDYAVMASTAPTSLVFGVWDSRATKVKIPRLVTAKVQARNVSRLQARAQYSPPIDYAELGLLDDVKSKKGNKDPASMAGLRPVPAPKAGPGPGGVLVNGDITRHVVVNLTPLRRIVSDTKPDVQKYILSLAMVAASVPMDPYLREGCTLVRENVETVLVRRDGSREDLALDTTRFMREADKYAKDFDAGACRTLNFEPKRVKDVIKKASKDV